MYDWPTVSGVEDKLASDAGVFVADYETNRVVHWAPGAEAGTAIAGGQCAVDGLHQLDVSAGVALVQTAASSLQTMAATVWCTGRLVRRQAPSLL